MATKKKAVKKRVAKKNPSLSSLGAGWIKAIAVKIDKATNKVHILTEGSAKKKAAKKNPARKRAATKKRKATTKRSRRR